MDRQNRQSADIPKWSALLVEAVNKPGLIMKAYSAFHSYSLGNQPIRSSEQVDRLPNAGPKPLIDSR